MVTRRRWTEKEDRFLLDLYNDVRDTGLTDDEIFNQMTNDFTDRTKSALQKRHYDLTSNKGKVSVIRKDESFNEFIQGIENLKHGYDVLYKENIELRKQLKELMQKEEDFAVMARVMEQARKLVVNEQLGEHEKSRFKMDGNGNLERI